MYFCVAQQNGPRFHSKINIMEPVKKVVCSLWFYFNTVY